jgi:hypothetical protein
VPKIEPYKIVLFLSFLPAHTSAMAIPKAIWVKESKKQK